MEEKGRKIIVRWNSMEIRQEKQKKKKKKGQKVHTIMVQRVVYTINNVPSFSHTSSRVVWMFVILIELQSSDDKNKIAYLEFQLEISPVYFVPKDLNPDFII